MSLLMTKIFKREYLLVLRSPSEYLNPLGFFILVVMLFPLTINASAQSWGVGVVWVAAFLSCLMSFDSLFSSDFRDGIIDQWLLSEHSIFLIALLRVLVHWFFTGFALIIISPVLGMMIGLSFSEILYLVIGLLLGTPVLSFLGAIMAALTLGAKQGGVLLSLLVLPLIIPVLIFGAGLVSVANSGMPILGYVAILGAMLVLAVSLVPFAIGAALRLSVE